MPGISGASLIILLNSLEFSSLQIDNSTIIGVRANPLLVK